MYVNLLTELFFINFNDKRTKVKNFMYNIHVWTTVVDLLYDSLYLCHEAQTIAWGEVAGLTLEGEEVALWLLTSLCTSAKREVEVALLILTVLTVKYQYIFTTKFPFFKPPL